MKIPWKTKGIVLTAPLTKEVDDVVEFIDKYLAPNGCNLIVMQIRYRYRFRLHPECQGYDPLSCNDVKKLVNVCKKHNIRLHHTDNPAIGAHCLRINIAPCFQNMPAI